MKYDVFISYSRKDYAEQIINEKGEKEERIIPGNIVSQTIKCLESNKISYWWDKDGIYSADQFIAVIAKAIRESSIFLFISTENSNESYWTPKEISAACHLKKKIIPFKVDDSYYTDSVLLLLSDVDFIDYSKDKKKAFEKLEISINRILEEQNRKEAEDSMLAAVEERLLKEYELKFKAEEERLRKEYELKLKAAEEERRRELETSVKARGKQPKEEEEKLPEIKPSPLNLQVATKNGKYGYVDEDKKVVIPLVYDSARKFSAEGFAAVKKDGEEFYIDKNGDRLHDESDDHHNEEETSQEEKKTWKYYLKTKRWVWIIIAPLLFFIGVIVYIPRPDYYVPHGRDRFGLTLVKKTWLSSEKYGYQDTTGKEVIPYIYDYADAFASGLACVKKDGKYGYIDETGKEVIPFIYDDAWSFYYGDWAVVEKDGKNIFINRKGEEIDVSSIAEDFSEGLAVVEEGERCGYIDKTGKVVIPCKYKYAYSFSEGLAHVGNSLWQWGYIDKTGREVIPFIYASASDFSEGLAAVEKDGKYGFIDKTGKEIVPCIYDYADSFSEGLAYVEKDGKYGYIDETGKEVIPCIYDDASVFSEGLARVKKDGRWGFIDKTGKEIIPCIYDSADFLSGGLARVKKDGKYGYIDETGKEVIPFIYDWAWNFSEGLARVEKDDKWGYIDKTGKEIVPCIYDYADSFSEGLAYVEKDGKYGYIDETGKEVIPCIYDNAWNFSEGLARVVKDREVFFIDKEGNRVID